MYFLEVVSPSAGTREWRLTICVFLVLKTQKGVEQLVEPTVRGFCITFIGRFDELLRILPFTFLERADVKRTFLVLKTQKGVEQLVEPTDKRRQKKKH